MLCTQELTLNSDEDADEGKCIILIFYPVSGYSSNCVM